MIVGFIRIRYLAQGIEFDALDSALGHQELGYAPGVFLPDLGRQVDLGGAAVGVVDREVYRHGHAAHVLQLQLIEIQR